MSGKPPGKYLGFTTPFIQENKWEIYRNPDLLYSKLSPVKPEVILLKSFIRQE
jgi:hypothetical protein